MNYKFFQSPPKHARYNCANNLDILKKQFKNTRITYQSPERSEYNHYQLYKSHQKTNYSPLRIDYKYTENLQNIRITSPKTRSSSRNKITLDAHSLHKKDKFFDNLNYGSPKIFHKLKPEQTIQSRLSTPVTPKLIPKFKPFRAQRSDTQYSVATAKSSNSLNKINVNRKTKQVKENSGLMGWYVDPIDPGDEY